MGTPTQHSKESAQVNRSLNAVKTQATDTVSSVADLKTTLADEYLLLLKTQNYHWNIEGPLFFSLHKLFEEQYKQLAEYVDRAAEVIRAMRTKAPGSFKEFNDLSSIQEALADKASSHQIIETLSQDHTNMAIALKARLEDAEDAEETSAVVLYEDLIQFHEKAAWMIRSHRS